MDGHCFVYPCSTEETEDPLAQEVFDNDQDGPGPGRWLDIIEHGDALLDFIAKSSELGFSTAWDDQQIRTLPMSTQVRVDRHQLTQRGDYDWTDQEERSVR